MENKEKELHYEEIERQIDEGIADMSKWTKEERIMEYKRLMNCWDTTEEERKEFKRLLELEMD